MAKKKQVTTAHCSGCIEQRRHEILHGEPDPWEEALEGLEDEEQPKGCNTYEMLKCCVCGYISLRVISWTSTDIDDDGQPIVSETYYPPPLLRRMPKWGIVFLRGDEIDVLRGLLDETHKALRAGCPRLAAMGVRSLIEQIMINKVGDQGSFRKNLKEFHSKGFISEKEQEFLNTALEVGHATIHRAYTPQDEDLSILIDLAERLIESVYVNPRKIRRLADKLPLRK